MSGWFSRYGLVCSLMLVSANVLASSDVTLIFYTEEYAPFSFSGQDQVKGINTELLEQAVTAVGVRAEFLVVPWGRAQLITQSQANACFYSAARTDERESQYQWAGPLSREQIALYTLNSDKPQLTSISDARQFRVGGQIADAYSAWAEDQGITVERVTQVADNLVKLKWGRIDLWLAGSIAGPYIAALNDMVIYPMAASEETFDLWLACNPALPRSLIDALDDTIRILKDDGSLDIIMKGYRLPA